MASIKDAVYKRIYQNGVKAGQPSLPGIPYADILGKTPEQRLGAVLPTERAGVTYGSALGLGKETSGAVGSSATKPFSYVEALGTPSYPAAPHGNGMKAWENAVNATPIRYADLIGAGSGATVPTAVTAEAGTATPTATGNPQAELTGSQNGGLGTMTAEERARALYDKALADANANLTDGTSVYKKLYEASLAAAEEKKREAIRYADILKERATVDARTEGELSRAGYGRYAEMLSGMGLLGSGYRDYIDGISVSAERQAVANAAAERERALRGATYEEILARKDAESEYEKGKFALETSYRDANATAERSYAEMLSGIEANRAGSGKSVADYSAMLGLTVGANDMADYVRQDGGSEEVAELVKKNAQNQVASGYLDLIKVDIDSVDENTAEEIMKEYRKGNISESGLAEIREAYSAGGVGDSTFRDENENAFSPSDAKAVYDAAMKNPLFTDSFKKQLETEYKRLYGTKTSSAKFNKVFFDGLKENVYWEYAGQQKRADRKVTRDANVKDVASRVEEMTIFEYLGKYYYRKGEKVFALYFDRNDLDDIKRSFEKKVNTKR